MPVYEGVFLEIFKKVCDVWQCLLSLEALLQRIGAIGIIYHHI